MNSFDIYINNIKENFSLVINNIITKFYKEAKTEMLQEDSPDRELLLKFSEESARNAAVKASMLAVIRQVFNNLVYDIEKELIKDIGKDNIEMLRKEIIAEYMLETIKNIPKEEMN